MGTWPSGLPVELPDAQTAAEHPVALPPNVPYRLSWQYAANGALGPAGIFTIALTDDASNFALVQVTWDPVNFGIITQIQMFDSLGDSAITGGQAFTPNAVGTMEIVFTGASLSFILDGVTVMTTAATACLTGHVSVQFNNNSSTLGPIVDIGSVLLTSP